MTEPEIKPRTNGSQVDPSKNVLDLVDASADRLNDLREAEAKRIDQIISFEMKRVEEIAVLRSRHIEEILRISSEYEKRLTDSEANRINAIRVVDVNAVAIQNERAAAQASVLAGQVATSAETLRALVATTAASTAIQSEQQYKSLSERIATLEKASYTGQGKEAVSDPAMSLLVSEMRAMRAELTENKGKGLGANQMWGWIVGAVGFALAALSLIQLLSK